jgi:hypothetical protein
MADAVDTLFRISYFALQTGRLSFQDGGSQLATLKVDVGPVTVEGVLSTTGRLFLTPHVSDPGLHKNIEVAAQTAVLERLTTAFRRLNETGG